MRKKNTLGYYAHKQLKPMEEQNRANFDPKLNMPI